MYENNVEIGKPRRPRGVGQRFLRGLARTFRAFEWFALVPYNYWLRWRGIEIGSGDGDDSAARQFRPLPHAELTEAERKAALEEYERQPRMR